jgi:hypothetical protein
MVTMIQNQKKIPVEVEDLVYADYQKALSSRLRRSYKLSFDDQDRMEDGIFKIIKGQLFLKDFLTYLKDNIKTPHIDFQNLAKDITGTRLLVIKDYLKSQGQDVEAFIQSLGGNAETYKKYIITAHQALAEEKNGTYDHDSYLYEIKKKEVHPPQVEKDETETISELELTPEERLSSLESFLSDQLVNILQSEGGETIESINHALLLTIEENKEYHQRIIKILSDNKMIIGQKPLIINGNSLPQTASNWLQDIHVFVNGEQLDSLLLAKYMNDSPNTKLLGEPDKSLLHRFLLFYQNILLFPKSFSSLPPEEWNLIPTISKPSESLSFAQQSNDLPITSIKAKVTSITPLVKQKEVKVPFKAVSFEKLKPVTPTPQTNQHINDSPELLSLKNLLLQYPVDSLERKAIEEEIKNLSL